MTVRKSTLEKAHLCNGGFNEHTHAHPKRAKFYELYQEGTSITVAVEQCLKVSLLHRCLGKAKSLVRRVLKKNFPISLAISK